MDTNILEIDVQGENYTVNALDIMDPTEEMAELIDRANDDEMRVSDGFRFARMLGVDTAGKRVSWAGEFVQAVFEALELSQGEADGSENASGPTAKKSSTRSSRQG